MFFEFAPRSDVVDQRGSSLFDRAECTRDVVALPYSDWWSLESRECHTLWCGGAKEADCSCFIGVMNWCWRLSSCDKVDPTIVMASEVGLLVGWKCE